MTSEAPDEEYAHGAVADAFISWDDGYAEHMSQLVDDGLVYPVIAESPRHAVPDEMPAPGQWLLYALPKRPGNGRIEQVSGSIDLLEDQVEGNDNGA